MKKIIFSIIILCFLNFSLAQTNSVLVFRSEFENIDDIIYDIEDNNENALPYIITSGNANNHYTINATSGEIKIMHPISDSFNNVHVDNLTVSIGAITYAIQIVDAFDYYLSNLPIGYSVLSANDEVFIDNNSSWTAFNNLWGKGDAIENQDFRIAILIKNTFPNETIFIWDVPSQASTFNGASVWGYNNLFWGNRKNIRENLPNFPFKFNSINALNFNFDFEQLFGSNEYKVALNLFATDVPTLANFNQNKGDFFFVFDQINNYLPPYPFSLPDINIDGKPFAVLYNNDLNGQFYQRRRIIIKNGNVLNQGTLNLKALFDMYSNAGYLNTNQSIPNIQIGLEITDGFGALRFNQIDFNITTLSLDEVSNQSTVFYPNPVTDKLFYTIKGEELLEINVFNSIGQKVITPFFSDFIDFSSLPNGLYFVNSQNGTEKIIKK